MFQKPDSHARQQVPRAPSNASPAKAVARRSVASRTIEEGMLNRVEAAIRCFDPCLSCSTHAAGRMPLMVELRDSRGELLPRVGR
jgi:NAD-reducing hydrogenase large subunit